ncbi:hypothetical protein JHK82_011905 [Glycine max]|nr:hypothetical protein JHK82_011905 [Glycine max]
MNTLPQTPGKTIPDACDYKGRPAERSKTGVEACERLTTMGVAVNLATYLTGTMHLGSANSANTVTNFMGTSLMLCLFGGFVADTFIGRSLQNMFSWCDNIDHINNNPKPAPSKMHKRRHQMLHVSKQHAANGALHSPLHHIPRHWRLEIQRLRLRHGPVRRFGQGREEADAEILQLVRVLHKPGDTDRGDGSCVHSGSHREVGSPLTQIAMVFVAAWRKRHLELPSDSSLLFNLDDVADESLRKNKQMLPHSKQFRINQFQTLLKNSFLDKAAIKDPKMDGEEITMQRNWYLSTLTDVEEVKMVQRILPVWATTIMFWTVYAQMTTFSVQQATTMDRRIGNSFQIPAASLTVFFVGSVLLTVPIYDRVITPIAKKISHNPQGLTPLQRIGVGLVFSIFAMVSAALIEIKRLRMAQFFFVGSGEAFTYIGQLDFFLRECPRGMKTMSTGLFLSTLSLGFFLSSLLVTLVHKATRHREPWLADNLNHGRLHHFYWLLALLSGVNLVAYLFCAKGYVYKDKRLAEAGIELVETDTACHA